MMLRTDDYEIAAFFGLVVVFEFCERLWPARRVDRWQDLKLDVFSFAFALTVNRVSTHTIRALVGDVTPAPLAAPIRSLQSLPSVWKIVLALFVVDFIIYWIHRAQHRFELLWRTHAWHHSIEQMYWFAGIRTSFLHSFIFNLPQVIIPDGRDPNLTQSRFGMYRWHLTDPVRFGSDIRVSMQALGWRSGGRYLPLQDDISSVAFWYQTLPTGPFPMLPDADGLEII